MTSFAPTQEQEIILAAFATGGSMVVDAGAGTGKTSTSELLARSTDRHGLYVAYNRAIKDEAEGRFPSNVECRTAHSLAYRETVKYPKSPMGRRLSGTKRWAKDQANILGITQPIGDDEGNSLNPTQIARLVRETVQYFCYSADSEISESHVPKQPGTEKFAGLLNRTVVGFAKKAWADINDPNGTYPWNGSHDYYLKMWALTNPKLNFEFIILDEAQDANPVIAQVIQNQKHAQLIMIGDRCQSIYGWRGATDAMSNFEADHRLVLSQSFRFGQSVADEANKWLDRLEAPLRLTGFEKMDTKVGPLDELPKGAAVLCRTNAGVLNAAMDAQENGQRAAIVGGAEPIKRLAEAALDLMNGRYTTHPELAAFKNWTQVQIYVREEEDAGQLRVMVGLIDQHGPHRIIEVADRCTDEHLADIICSTAHKAKGREWDYVRVSSDFQPKVNDETGEIAHPSRPEMMLLYVTVTRARLHLDNESLAWVDGAAQIS